jgi:hypothetical protein
MCTVVHLVSIIKGRLIQLAQFDIYQVSVGKILCKIVLGSCKTDGDVRVY